MYKQKIFSGILCKNKMKFLKGNKSPEGRYKGTYLEEVTKNGDPSQQILLKAIYSVNAINSYQTPMASFKKQNTKSKIFNHKGPQLDKASLRAIYKKKKKVNKSTMLYNFKLIQSNSNLKHGVGAKNRHTDQ